MTKFNRKEYNKAYKEANKEKIKISDKAWRDKNPEALSKKRREWRERHPDDVIANASRWRKKNTLPYYIVYALPAFNEAGDIYCGVTNQPIPRMQHHKSVGRDASEWFILDICRTKKEALIIEAQYHDQGYRGKHGDT